jgi:hypothetical protein
MKTIYVLLGIAMSLSFAGVANAARPLSLPLLTVDAAPAVQGNTFFAFVRSNADYFGSYVAIDASLDGVAVAMEHPVGDLWIFNAAQFEKLASHTLVFTVSLESAAQADQLNGSLCKLKSQIQDLQNQIANTTDPAQLADLNSQLTDAQNLQAQLTADLAALKNPIGTQNFTFSVQAAPSNSTTFPRITSVSPNVGPMAGGTAISINGANFGVGATVSIGGVAATNVVVVSATSITASTPALPTPGVQDVLVSLPLASGDVEQKQALLSSGFFASSSRGSLLEFNSHHGETPACGGDQ